MNIRQARDSDLPDIKRIHQEYYKDDFDFEELFDHIIDLFVITDENDKVICLGGVRAIAESVLITDKGRSVLERREALSKVLTASEFIAKQTGFNQLHAFVQDTRWQERLKKSGFRPTVGQALVLVFED